MNTFGDCKRGLYGLCYYESCILWFFCFCFVLFLFFSCFVLFMENWILCFMVDTKIKSTSNYSPPTFLTSHHRPLKIRLSLGCWLVLMLQEAGFCSGYSSWIGQPPACTSAEATVLCSFFNVRLKCNTTSAAYSDSAITLVDKLESVSCCKYIYTCSMWPLDVVNVLLDICIVSCGFSS